MQTHDIQSRKIDLKHHVAVVQREDGSTVATVVKTGNGQEIPENEPMILFRGRDRLAVPMLHAYRDLCVKDGCNDFQLGQIDELIHKFVAFASINPDVMKQPGVTRGL